MRVVILASLSDDKLRSKILPIAKLENVEVIYLVRRRPLKMPKVVCFVPPQLFLLYLPLAELYRFIVLIWLCLFRKPKAIISIFFFPNGIYAGLVGSITRIRVIQVLIGSDLSRVISSKLWMALLTRASWIAVRGTNSRDKLVSLGVKPEVIFTPPNVLDLQSFKPDQYKDKLGKIYDLIYVGNLLPVKCIDFLLEIVAQARLELPDLKVAIIGDGPERRRLHQLCEQLQLGSAVDFLGQCPQTVIAEHLTNTRAFIMTSRSEGLPMAMIEAISCGLPVIMPDVNDVTDVAKHHVNALIVNPPTKENYVNAIIEMLTNESMYHRLVEGAFASRRRFEQEFTLESVAYKWRNVLA